MRVLFKRYLQEMGRKGGLKRNPRKGFGSGDNARRAVSARWAKYRLEKAQSSQANSSL